MSERFTEQANVIAEEEVQRLASEVVRLEGSVKCELGKAQ